MNGRDAFRWTMLYRGVSAVAFLLGTGLAIVGFVVGFGGSLSTLLADPSNPGRALEAVDPVLTLAFVALGVLVWQVGKSYALFLTVPRAAGRAAAEEVDTQRMRSELLEVLDDRLAEFESDLEQTRRSVEELERSDHATAFDERDHLESSTATASTAGGEGRGPGDGSDVPGSNSNDPLS